MPDTLDAGVMANDSVSAMPKSPAPSIPNSSRFRLWSGAAG